MTKRQKATRKAMREIELLQQKLKNLSPLAYTILSKAWFQLDEILDAP